MICDSSQIARDFAPPSITKQTNPNKQPKQNLYKPQKLYNNSTSSISDLNLDLSPLKHLAIFRNPLTHTYLPPFFSSPLTHPLLLPFPVFSAHSDNLVILI